MAAFSRLQERASGFLSTFPEGFTRVGENWRFVRNFTILSGGSVLAQVFSVALAPLITRLYLPFNLGQLGLFTSFINLATVAASLRYEFAIVSAKDDREAAQLTLSSFLLAFPISVLAAFVFYALVANNILGYGRIPLYSAMLLVPAFIATAAFSALRYWLVRKDRFGLIAHSSILQNAGRALSQAALGWLGPHTASLLAGEIMGRCSGMSRMLRATWPILKRDLAGSNFHQIKDTLKTNRHFAVYSLPSSILDALAAALPLPVLIYLYGLDVGGNYALVGRVLAVPAVLITANVADAFHCRAALMAQQDPLALPGFVKRVGGVLLLLGIFPAIILVAFGPPLFHWVFGNKWNQAGVMSAWVAPWFLAQFVVSPLSRIVLVVGRQEMKFIYDIVTFGGTILVFFLAHLRGWPIMLTLAALSGLKTLAYAVFYLLLIDVSSAHRQLARPAVGDLR
jgi:lipopolysaccharide exporter